jgi:hypothetical protein
MKKSNLWQKPDLSSVEPGKKTIGSSRSGKNLYGVGIPPMPPTRSGKDLYGVGVPPMPPAVSTSGVGVPPMPPAMPKI